MTTTVRVSVNGDAYAAKCTKGDDEPVYIHAGEAREFHIGGVIFTVEEMDAGEAAAAGSGGGGHDTPPNEA